MRAVKRLVVLVPAQTLHLVRYHKTGAPSANGRARILPASGESPRSGAEGSEPEPSPSRITWANLLRRVFAIDVLQCPSSSGRMQIIATVTDLHATKMTLMCIGLPT